MLIVLIPFPVTHALCALPSHSRSECRESIDQSGFNTECFYDPVNMTLNDCSCNNTIWDEYRNDEDIGDSKCFFLQS